MPATVDPTPWIQFGGIGVAVLAFALAFILPRLLRRKRPVDASPVVAAADPSPPSTCHFCEAPAVRAPSRFVGSEGFGAEMRVRFGAAQRYAPVIDSAYAPTLCAAHARTWDALLTEKMATTVERERRAAEVRIASEMAAFESEGLAAAMAKSLTATQAAAFEARKKPN